MGLALAGPARCQSRSLKNHPIQTMGTHILHFAEIGLTESGIHTCCPVHDAVLTECRIDQIDGHVKQVQAIMRQASKAALGLEISVDSKVVRHPGRYMDKRGKAMFEKATVALKSIESVSSIKGDIGRVHHPQVSPIHIKNTILLVPHELTTPKYEGLKYPIYPRHTESCVVWAAPRWLEEIITPGM